VVREISVRNKMAFTIESRIRDFMASFTVRILPACGWVLTAAHAWNDVFKKFFAAYYSIFTCYSSIHCLVDISRVIEHANLEV
jgi:hypothetical protein